MRTSLTGIDLIKKFEGCRLTAYKAVPTEQYYTIGYGHYGADVAPSMTITQATADALLVKDLERFEYQVNDTGLSLNQNQFDALVSFTYNCGGRNLLQLVKNRTLDQIADALLLYNKAGGKVLEGLNRRRIEERELFLMGMETRANGNPYDEPVAAIKRGQKGNGVRWLQYQLNEKGHYKLIVDGIFGPKTQAALMDFQNQHGLVIDGICGPATRMALLK
jgi:GH24 family phage-related lysozyme (muramidase)